MPRSKLIAPLILMFSFQVHAQDFYWTQYANENPAAAGTDSRFAISSVAGLTGNIITQRIAAEGRIKKLHGGFSAGYNFQGRLDNDYSYSSPFVNYSFHIKTGENSLLAFGAGVEYYNQRFSPENHYRYEGIRYKSGVHFQYKGIKTGVAFETYEDAANRRHIALSNIYLDYTYKFGSNWALNASAFAGRFEAGVQLRATCKDKYWLSMSHSLYKKAGATIGMNITENLSLGYSIGMEYWRPGGELRFQHGLMVKFRLR